MFQGPAPAKASSSSPQRPHAASSQNNQSEMRPTKMYPIRSRVRAAHVPVSTGLFFSFFFFFTRSCDESNVF